ncbi:MAG: hypothetical protein ABFS34_16705 [Gemmatimonadota bacterium]
MNSLESDLTRLPEPESPAGLSAGVMARIARLEKERTVGAGEPPRVAVTKAGRERLAWAAALAGVTAGLGAQAYRLFVGEATFQLTSLRISGGMQGIIEMPPASPAVAVLAAGLLLYLGGLFASLNGAGHR